MKKETLFDKIQTDTYWDIKGILKVKDVKEFIRRIEEDIRIWTTEAYFKKIKAIIKSRAGEELIK